LVRSFDGEAVAEASAKPNAPQGPRFQGPSRLPAAALRNDRAKAIKGAGVALRNAAAMPVSEGRSARPRLR